MTDAPGAWQMLASWLRSVLLGVGAGVLMLCAAILALEDRLAAATVMAGLFLSVVIVLYLPEIEHFKGFGVEAKMRETLRQAEVTIEQIRRIALVTTKQAYFVLASVGRMTDVRIGEKNSLAKSLGMLLDELDIHPSEKNNARQPYVRMIGVDLASVFNSCVHLLVFEKSRQIEADARSYRTAALAGDASATENLGRLTIRREALELASSTWPNAFESVETFRRYASQPVFAAEFAPDDLERLRKVGDHLILLFRECEAAGYFTENAEAFISEFGPYARGGTGLKLMNSRIAGDRPSSRA